VESSVALLIKITQVVINAKKIREVLNAARKILIILPVIHAKLTQEANLAAILINLSLLVILVK
jgi:hypothetical protein